MRFLWQLTLLACVLALAGILILPRTSMELSLTHYLVTLAAFLLINTSAWLIMHRGITKNKREGAMILLAGISGKFLLYLLYILLFWLLTKNISKAFILTFFALYLVFTFFIASSLLKLLKTK